MKIRQRKPEKKRGYLLTESYGNAESQELITSVHFYKTGGVEGESAHGNEDGSHFMLVC